MKWKIALPLVHDQHHLPNHGQSFNIQQLKQQSAYLPSGSPVKISVPALYRMMSGSNSLLARCKALSKLSRYSASLVPLVNSVILSMADLAAESHGHRSAL